MKKVKFLQHEDEMVTEGKIMQQLHTHQCFPFLYGLVGKKGLIMELIANNDGSISQSVHQMFFPEEPITKHLKIIVFQIIDAFNYLHGKGFLHNDIHGGNIIIRDHKFVKVIDFGKVTLLSKPLKYRLTKEKQKLYNARHKHLAYELRNIPDSKQSIQTDIYSIGFLFQKYFTRIVKHRTFSKVVSRMVFINPEMRPSLKTVYLEIDQSSF